LTATLILIRHGQTEHNSAGLIAGWTDSPLAETGRAQARGMAAHVAATYRLDAIYASPLQRARDTALALSEATGLPPIMDPDLREQHFGDVEGFSDEQLRLRYPELVRAAQVVDDLSFSWPGGERRSGFFGRVRAVMDRIIVARPGETVAVVTHGGVIGSFVADVVQGKPWLWRRYLVDNCSVTVVTDDGGTRQLGLYNDTSFLPAAKPDPLTSALREA
jgi:broad specificity phosphatase PhoE